VADYRAHAEPEPPNRVDWIIALFLFAGLSFIYFATLSGITSSNDGSHYALLRTMVENRVFTLNQFDDFAEGNDIAVTPDGRLFSDRPPGTALAAIPFYVLGGLLPDAALTQSRHDAANPRLAYVLLLPVFAGAGTAVLLYALMRHLGIGRAAALLAVLFFALSTTHWKYSTVLFSHALSGFLVVASVYLVLRLVDGKVDGWPWFALLGFILGLAVLVEYSNVPLVVAVGAFWLWRLWPRAARQPLATILPWLAGGLIPAAFLAWYNTTNFGGPFTTSYTYAINYPWAGSFTATFSFPLLPGLRALLWRGEGGGWCGGPCLNQGIFLLSPVLLLALPGLIIFIRRRRPAFFLLMGLFTFYLLLFAQHHTFHGFTGDGRYLTPFLGLLAPAMGFALDWLLAPRRQPLIRPILVALVLSLFFFSLGNQLLHIGASYNYTLDPAQLRPPLARPGNWAVLARAVFPNAANWPALILPLAAVCALFFLARWRAQANRLQAQ
jgi:4-amino-4-deoxy-L-arabinose transferase-like glycosyltransferase